MKNYKKFAAIAMAATMLAGSGLTAFAGDTGTDTGEGKYEGSVDETSAFTVDVPTNAANVFDFFVDPNGLLKETNYARFSGKTSADFEADATLFFTRTPSDSVKEFGKDSDSVTLTNMSSYQVDVEVTASIVGADGITLVGDSGDTADTEGDPTLYLAIASGGQTKAITSEGVTFTGNIDGKADNYEIKWNSGDQKYEYGLVDGVTASVSDTNAGWESLSFNLTGACGGDWTNVSNDIAPSVTLTWKITDPKGPAAPSIAITSYNYDRTQSLTITTSLGQGNLGATAIKKVEASNDGVKVAADYTSVCTISGNTITLPSAKFGGVSVGGKGYLFITFDDAAATKVVVTLNVTK